VNIGTRTDSITVPERAIVELQGKTFVWIVGSDGKVTQRGVLTGEQAGSRLIINEGLKVGEKIVIDGINKLREGMPVKVSTATVAEKAPVSPEPPAQE
jgi:membrane fusion protein (multidrug efflux system)